MLNFEPAREVAGGFDDYGDALWWTGMLVAGSGTDFWPATTEGRLLTMLLSLYGLAVFGYIAATFASFWMTSGRPITKPVRTPGAISFVNEHMKSVRSGASE